MVCTEFEKLCGKFKSLSPHKRIDILCGLLRMCLPTELRFIGSIVEDIAKKDYHSFREHEIKANSHAKLIRYKHVDDRTLRHGMALTLALLHSWNANCANTIFEILHSNLKTAFDVTSETDEESRYVILLVLMMAKNHPAFTFYQRSVIGEHNEAIERKLHNQFETVELNNPASPVLNNTVSSQDSPAVSLSMSVDAATSPVHCLTSDHRVPVASPTMVIPDSAYSPVNHSLSPPLPSDDSLSPSAGLPQSPSRVQIGEPISPHGLSPVAMRSPVSQPMNYSGAVPSPPNISKGCSCTADPPSPATTPHRSKVHICNIEVKSDKLPRRHDRKHEYRLQVTWSNGESSEVLKTYQELREFQAKLVKLFPSEANAPKQERKLPFLGSASNREESADQNFHNIVNYTKQLTKQSQQILECDLILQFFKKEGSHLPSSPKSNSQPSTRLPIHSPVQNTGQEASETVINYIPSQSFVVHNSHLQQHPNAGPVHSGSIMTVQMRPPGAISPYNSPHSSTRSSPSNSRSTSPGDSNHDLNLILFLIQKLGLQKHKTCLEKYTSDQLSNMNGDDLIKMGLTRAEANKLKSEVDLITREKNSSLPNGLMETNIGPNHPPHGGAPIMIHPGPPHHLMQPPQMYHPLYYPIAFPHAAPQGLARTRDSSPTGSDYSSPSPSPRPQKKQPPPKTNDSSSDDNEKLAGKDMNDGIIPRQPQGLQTEDGKVIAVTPNVVPTQGEAPPSFPNLGSGYQSDPTPSNMAPRIPGIMARPPYKAQPAHTNHNIPPKHVISMPPDSVMVKRNGPYGPGIPVGMAPPIPRSDVPTSAAVSSPASFNVTAMEVSTHKPFYLYTHPGFPVRSPLNGRNFMCNVTNSTAITMATQVLSHPATNGMKLTTGHMTSSVSDGAVAQHVGQEITCTRHDQNIHSVAPVLQQNVSVGNTSTSVSYSTNSGNLPNANNSNHQPNVTNNAGTTCSSCGCPGYSCTYPYHPPNALPHPLASAGVHGQFLPWPPHLAPTSNGLMPQLYRHTTGLSYHLHPPSTFPNGLSPDLLPLNSPYLHHGMQAPLLNLHNSSGCYQYHSLLRHGSQNDKPRRITCHNCGSTDHVASECRENSMEYMAGHFHLMYEPKSNSD